MMKNGTAIPYLTGNQQIFSSISMGEVIIASILQGFDQKKQNHFFWGVFLVQVQ